MIRAQQTKKFRDFRGGRLANENPATMPENHLLIAKNVMCLGDGMVRRRFGYTQVAAKTVGAALKRGFDFVRQTDKKQFVMLTGNGKIAFMNVDGSGYQEISRTEVQNAIFSFVTAPQALYLSDGSNSYALVDTGDGLLSKHPLGIPAPQVAPTFAIGAGTLNLTNGTQYVICPVRRWTDKGGTHRYHIGAPSPRSAHTGPLVSSIVNLNLPVAFAADATVTHWWIFKTLDSPFETTSFFGFAAEVPIGTAVFGDTLTDAQIDTTREAPWDNLQAPAGNALLDFSGRSVLLGVDGVVYVSGAGEIDLGDPRQAFPLNLQFPVPSGTKQLVGGCVIDKDGVAILNIATPDFFFEIWGTDSTNLQMREKSVSPGICGKKAIDVLPGWQGWFGSDKKFWTWDGASSDPTELALKIGRSAIPGVLTLENISDAQLSNVEVLYYGYGSFFWILIGCSTDGAAGFNWIQIWDGSNITRGSQATQIEQTSADLMAECDMFPADRIATMWLQRVGTKLYVYFSDMFGAIYRFPDGLTDNGQPIADGVMGTVVSDLDSPDVAKQMLHVDVFSTRVDAKDSFKIFTAVSDGVLPGGPQALEMKAAVSSYGTDPSIARGDMKQRGTSVGKSVQVIVKFPADAQEAIISAIDVINRPLYEVTP